MLVLESRNKRRYTGLMILQEDQASGQFQIKAYKPGEIIVNETIYTHSLIISANTLIADWGPNNLSEIDDKSWDPILALKPAFLIFGTGPKFVLPPASFFAKLYQNNIAVEAMDSAAACRTLTALMSENRNVIAAILV